MAEKFILGNAFFGFDHIHWFVGNSKVSSDYYAATFGFEKVAFRGLETGYRNSCSFVLKRNNIFFIFTSAYARDSKSEFGDSITEHVSSHGDGVKDVAFRVLDCKKVYHEALLRGAIPVRAPFEMQDSFGKVVVASLKTYGDTVHTLIERKNYSGVFLPGFQAIDSSTKIQNTLPVPDLKFIDHVVGNQGDGQMEPAANWYRDKLDFHRFWTVDDKQIHTQYSALRSIVMADNSLSIKMPINEPAQGLKKSQIQEFVEFYHGPGVQHIALNTPDCIETVTRLRARGVEFLQTPASYYQNLQVRLANARFNFPHNLTKLQELNILVDFDESGYLLQIFTKPLQDR